MNTFFYTPTGSETAKRYLKRLQRLSDLEEMTVLPTMSPFLSPLALKLRSGDLIIIFAANSRELDELLALQNDFSDFRIILILADSRTLRKGHLLRPNFLAFQDETIVRVESVIQKITVPDKLMV